MASMVDMPRSARNLGSWGEELAAEYLRGLGWHVVARNWRCSLGELDVIGLEPTAEGRLTGVVVEVKCRSGIDYGDPLEAITAQKVRRLRTLAGVWYRDYGLQLSGLRVDAIGISKLRGLAPQLRHVRGLA